MRISPIRHIVKKHRRLDKPVSEYERGNRNPSKHTTPKLKGIKETPIKQIHPKTPSGRLTENLCTLSKGQTLLWEDEHGSERVITGIVSQKMKIHDCPTCWQAVLPGEKAVMTQDYFPFRHYMVVQSVYHLEHFPFDVSNPIQAEKDIQKYIDRPTSEYNHTSIYDFEQDTIKGKFKSLAKFRSPKPLSKPHWRRNWIERFMYIKDINVPKVWNENRYKDALEQTQKTGKVPPIDVVWNDTTKTWEIQDGIHRTNAVKHLGYSSIPVLMTENDAKIYDNQT
jgi:hypothetical protein